MTFALVIVLVFAVLGAPLFAVFGGAALELFSSGGLDTTGVAIDVFGDKFANSPTLVTIPLFTFAGYLMAESGTPKRLVEVSRAVFGWLPGGLAMVALAASAFFTTFTGGSGITIVAVGGLLYPALLSDRYPKSFSLGLVTTGGSLGLLFPPSLPIILYAVVANIDVDPLFLAGVVPGLVTVAALFLYSLVLARRSKVPSTKFDLRAAGRAIWMAKWELLLPVALVAGLLGGLRIHEASAFTAVYVLVVQCFVYKDLSVRRDVPRIVRESMTMVGAILAILACALGFTSFLIQAEVPAWILDKMESLITSQFMFLLVLNLFLLVVGMLMDIFSAIVVVVPLIVPIANHFCVHPVHLGITFLLNLEIGYLTPPVGLNLFISSFRFRETVTVLYRAVLPFIGVLVVSLLLVTYLPGLSLWLPGVFGKLPPGPTPTGGGLCAQGSGAAEGEGTDRPPPADETDAGTEEGADGDGGEETLDDLEGGGEGETLDDLEGGSEGETLDDLEGGADAGPIGPTPASGDAGTESDAGAAAAPAAAPDPEGETLDDLERGLD